MGQAEIEVGARVVVRGMKKRDDLIGREGVAVVGTATASNGRWEVRLEGQAKTIAVQLANLERSPDEKARRQFADS